MIQNTVPIYCQLSVINSQQNEKQRYKIHYYIQGAFHTPTTVAPASLSKSKMLCRNVQARAGYSHHPSTKRQQIS